MNGVSLKAPITDRIHDSDQRDAAVVANIALASQRHCWPFQLCLAGRMVPGTGRTDTGRDLRDPVAEGGTNLPTQIFEVPTWIMIQSI